MIPEESQISRVQLTDHFSLQLLIAVFSSSLWSSSFPALVMLSLRRLIIPYCSTSCMSCWHQGSCTSCRVWYAHQQQQQQKRRLCQRLEHVNSDSNMHVSKHCVIVFNTITSCIQCRTLFLCLYVYLI